MIDRRTAAAEVDSNKSEDTANLKNENQQLQTQDDENQHLVEKPAGP